MAIKDRLYDVPVVGTALRLQDRYKDDDADQYAAALGFFGFLSLFPLLVLVLSVAGFVVVDDPVLQQRLVEAIQGSIPGFSALLGDESQIATAVDTIVENRGSIGLLGVATLLVAGLRVITGAMAATNHVFHIDVEATGWRLWVRKLGSLVLLGGLALGGVAASSAAGASVTLDVSSVASVIGSIGGTLLSILLDFLLYLIAYRILAGGNGPAWRRIWPGALLGAIGWTALKVVGGTYVSSQISKASELYGALGGVIALLLLLYLAGRLYLYGAELSALLYAPGANMAHRSEKISYRGEDPKVLPHGPVRARPGQEGDLAPPGRPEDRQGTPAGEDHAGELEDERRSRRPSPEEVSAAISPATAERVAIADRDRREQDTGPDVRGALALVLGAGALGAMIKFLGPSDD